jgi:lipopolysaccharide export system permease protein
VIKVLDRYILKELIKPTLFGLMIFGSLWMVNLLIRTVELFVTKGVAGKAVFLIFLYSMPMVLVTAAPMACLLGALLAMGRLNADSEIIAAKGCGIGYLRLMMPVFVAGVLVSLVSFVFNDVVVPTANRKQEEIFINEVVLKKPMPKVAKNVFFDGGDKFRIFMRRYRPEEQVMEEVTCYQFERDGFPRITEAREARMEEHLWTFTDGVTYVYTPTGQLSQMVRFGRWSHPFSLRHGPRVGNQPGSAKEMSFWKLWKRIEEHRAKGLNTTRDEVDLWFKTAFPFANLFLVLVGTPLASRNVRGKGGGVGLAILIMFVYYVSLAVGKAMGNGGTVSPILGAWAPNILMALVSVYLIRSTAR